MMTMKRKHYTLRRFADDAFTYTTLIIVSLIFVFPCLWLVLASFSKSGSLYEMRGFFPAEYSVQTFVELFTDDVNGLYPYKKWFMNTLYVASMSCIFGTILVILTGYVMSKFNFKGRNGVKKLTLVLGMFPGFMGMTAIYIIMAQLNLLNRLEIFWKITMPLSKPMLVYTALTQFAWPWSDCLLPKLILKSRDQWTVAVGLYSMPETHFSRFAAGSVFIAVPIVILYFFLVKHIVSGLTAGAVKG